MHRQLTFLCVLLTAVSLHAAVTAGPERPVAAPQAVGAYGANYVIDLATDGTDYLTLWQDSTPGRAGIYATVVDDRGVARAVPAAPLAGGNTARVQVVWTGSAYLAVFAEQDSVKAMLLNRDAQLVSGPNAIGQPGSGVMELAWNGSRALAVIFTPSGMRAAILGPSGDVIRSNIDLPADVRPWGFTVAAAGETFVLAWPEEVEPQQVGRAAVHRVRAMRIAADGTAGTPFVLREAAVGWIEMDSASSATEAGIAFTSDDLKKRTLYRFTLDATTVLSARPAMEIPYEARGLQVVATPSGFVTASIEPASENRLHVVRFDEQSARTMPIDRNVSYSMLAESNGHSAMIVSGGTPVRASVFDASFAAARSNALPVALAPAARQSTPAIAYGDNVTMVAWREPVHATTARLMVRRFDRAGNALDPEPIVAGEQAAMNGGRIGVAFTGRMWLVVWTRESGVSAPVVMRRISPEGTVLDDAPIVLGPGFDPSIASNRQVAVVTMTESRRRGVFLMRLSADGEKLDSSLVKISEADGEHGAVGTNGTELLVTWTALGAVGIYGRRLDASGASMDAAPIAIATGPQSETNPHVASNGTDYVVVYNQYTPRMIVDPPLPDAPTVIYHVRAKRLLRNGALADFTAAQDGHLLGRGVLPRIAPHAGRYFVTFVMGEGDSGGTEPDPLRIQALTADATGAAINEPRTVVRAESDPLMHDLALVGDSVWMTYARLAPETGNVQRVFVRTLFEEAAPRRRTSRK
jgi:hypothetical protein